MGCKLSELQMLLKRIKRQPRFMQATNKPPPKSENLQFLMGTVQARQWRKNILEELNFVIMQFDAEVSEAEHILECKECLLVVKCGVERYLGTRGPWWVDISNEIAVPDEDWEDEEWSAEFDRAFPGLPKAKDYEIGWYRHESEDTVRFIKDRAKWAAERAEKLFKAACRLARWLENYDVRKGIPKVFWIDGMLDLIVEGGIDAETKA